MSVPSPSPSILSPTNHHSASKSRPTPIMTTTTSNEPTTSPGSLPKSADNWRDRSSVGSIPKSAGLATRTVPGAGGRVGPERTVGGFEKREVRSGSIVSPVREREKENKDKEKEKDKDADSKAALSHVPCRFFKAGACTAGSSCQFSHAAPEPGKKEVCQWYLKGNCKFGHKCALAHVRPGEPLSMDRKNKREAQKELRERSEGNPPQRKRDEDNITSPVPIKSAISASLQAQAQGYTQPQIQNISSPPSRVPTASSPMREPYGPPSAVGSPSNGFAIPRPPLIGFASSPSRPSPLSASFSGRNSVPGPISLKSTTTTSLHSSLRPPATAAPGPIFSSSFSHATLSVNRAERPMSASYVDPIRNIWARHDISEEPLSPARRLDHRPLASGVGIHHIEDDEDDEHGEDFLPSSLNELLTPVERARRLSRRDSQDSGSPRSGFLGHGLTSSNIAYLPSPWGGPERLAQSAGATMGPGGFLQGLWSPDGEDARKSSGLDFNTTPLPPVAPIAPRQSLLTQQRTPISQSGFLPPPVNPVVPDSYIIRDRTEASSPTAARVLKEHHPGQSLPQGLAAGLSRLHLRGPRVSGLSALGGNSNGKGSDAESGPEKERKKEEHDDDEVDLFTMDG